MPFLSPPAAGVLHLVSAHGGKPLRFGGLSRKDGARSAAALAFSTCLVVPKW